MCVSNPQLTETWALGNERALHTHRLCELVSASSGGLLEGLCFQGILVKDRTLSPVSNIQGDREALSAISALFEWIKNISYETWVREEKTTGLIEVPWGTHH